MYIKEKNKKILKNKKKTRGKKLRATEALLLKFGYKPKRTKFGLRFRGKNKVIIGK
jgi:hypothetical protein